jgi:hypothetical protein
MKHLLKTPKGKVADRRIKGKHYFRLLFAAGMMGFFDSQPPEGACHEPKTGFSDF